MENPFALNVGWALIAAYLRLNKDELLRVGAEQAKRLMREALEKKWAKAAAEIARKMAKEGWSLTTRDAAAVVADAQYRLWRVVFPSGLISDAFRDSHREKIRQMVGPVEVTTPLEELVRRVIRAEVDLTF